MCLHVGEPPNSPANGGRRRRTRLDELSDELAHEHEKIRALQDEIAREIANHQAPPAPRRFKLLPGGLAAVPLFAWARDHHVPTMLVVAAVGGALSYTPSLAPYMTPLPPQSAHPAATAPPLDARPAPPTQPDARPDVEPPQATAGLQTGEPPATTAPQTATPAPDATEPPATTPPPTTTQPDPDDGRQQPPAEPPPESPPPAEPDPDCAEVLPAPGVDVDGCLAEVGQVIDSVG